MKILTVTILLIVALTIFVLLVPAVRTIDASAQPEIVQWIVAAIKAVFNATPIALAVGYARNTLGFLENWLRARYSEEEVKYEVKMLAETWAKYEAGVLLISLWLPGPISAAVTFVLDVVTSAIRKLKT